MDPLCSVVSEVSLHGRLHLLVFLLLGRVRHPMPTMIVPKSMFGQRSCAWGHASVSSASLQIVWFLIELHSVRMCFTVSNSLHGSRILSLSCCGCLESPVGADHVCLQ